MNTYSVTGKEVKRGSDYPQLLFDSSLACHIAFTWDLNDPYVSCPKIRPPQPTPYIHPSTTQRKDPLYWRNTSGLPISLFVTLSPSLHTFSNSPSPSRFLKFHILRPLPTSNHSLLRPYDPYPGLPFPGTHTNLKRITITSQTLQNSYRQTSHLSYNLFGPGGSDNVTRSVLYYHRN